MSIICCVDPVLAKKCVGGPVVVVLILELMGFTFEVDRRDCFPLLLSV